MPQEREICCFWGGGALNYLELTSLASMAGAGHPVTVYAYDPPPNAPDNVDVRDAAKILPRGAAPDTLTQDLFRYRLLAAREGVIWMRPDFALLGPLRTEEGRLLAHQGGGWLSPDILALPPDSAALGALLTFTEERRPAPPWLSAKERAALEARDEDYGPEDLGWGVWGTKALTHFAAESGEIEAASSEKAFYPLPYAERSFLLTRKAKLNALTEKGASAIPLYGAELARHLVEVEDGLPRYWTPLGTLMREFGVSPRRAPIGGVELTEGDRWADVNTTPAEPSASAPALTRVLRPVQDVAAPQVCIVTTMKNEGPFILEWIAYHRSIGIRNFLVYTNDCDDGTDEMHDLLAAKGMVTEHHVNPFGSDSKAKDPQRAALWDAQDRQAIKEADWIIPMDVDEFVNIHVGQGQFRDMLAAAPGANMISMVWRLFGNGFQSRYRDEFITETMTWCAHERCNKPHQAWGFKTAFKDIGAYKHFSVHRPQQLFEDHADQIRWYGASGRPFPNRFKKSGWRVGKTEAGYDMVTLNHYSVRSSESYLVKRQRGRVNHVDRDQGLAYWFRMNHNAEQDTSIANKLPGAKAEFQRLMADKDIAAMHRRCVAAHQARIEELRGDPDYMALYEEIESRRLQNLSRMLKHFGNAIFSVGPDAAPEEFKRLADEMEPVGGI